MAKNWMCCGGGLSKLNVPLRTVLFQDKVFLSSSGMSAEPPAQARFCSGSQNDSSDWVSSTPSPHLASFHRFSVPSFSSVLAAPSLSMLLPYFGYSSSSCSLYSFTTYGEGARRRWGKGSCSSACKCACVSVWIYLQSTSRSRLVPLWRPLIRRRRSMCQISSQQGSC